MYITALIDGYVIHMFCNLATVILWLLKYIVKIIIIMIYLSSLIKLKNNCNLNNKQK